MPPWLLLAMAVSLLAALGFQIVRAKSVRRVPIYWLTILVGFLLAEALAERVHFTVIRLGELAVIPDLIGIAVAILILTAVGL